MAPSVPAIFYFELTPQNRAVHLQTVILAGTPLDLAIISINEIVSRVVVAIDPGDSATTSTGDSANSQEQQQPLKKGLQVLDWDNHALVLQPVFAFLDADLAPDELEVEAAELRRLLYGVENLRKRIDAADLHSEPDAELETEVAGEA